MLGARTLAQVAEPGASTDRTRPTAAPATAPAVPAAPAADEKAKADEEVKKEKEKLLGTWKVVKIEEKGQSKEDSEDVRLVFDGDGFVFKKGDQAQIKGKFKLDPSKDPKAIDMEIAESVKPGREGKTSLSIYAWDKDDTDALKLCLGEPGDTDRPKEFAAPAGTKCIFLTLKREADKEAKPADPATPKDEKAQAEEDAKKEKEKLHGTWKVVTVEEKGQSKEDTDDARVAFDGDEFMLKKGDQVFAKGKFKLDPSKDPKAIDLEITESAKKGLEGKTSLAIYALDKDDKDALKLCLGEPGNTDRPKEFSGAAETKCVFLTLKREKK